MVSPGTFQPIMTKINQIIDTNYNTIFWVKDRHNSGNDMLGYDRMRMDLDLPYTYGDNPSPNLQPGVNICLKYDIIAPPPTSKKFIFALGKNLPLFLHFSTSSPLNSRFF